MIPWLIAGAVGAVVAGAIMDDDKKELKTDKTREQVSASEVPEEIRRQIEGGRSNISSSSPSAKVFYEAENYFYGRNGFPVNVYKAKQLYIKAHRMGYTEAANRFGVVGIKYLGNGVYQY